MKNVTGRDHVALVVDDEPQIFRLTCRLLRSESCQVLYASNQTSALEQLTPDIDAVLLDLHLKNSAEDGLSILRSIRTSQYSTIPVCILSADVTTECLFRALLLRANGYLCKTDDIQVLRSGLVDFIHYSRTGLLRAENADDVFFNYLRTRGLTEKQICLLEDFQRTDFTDGYTLAAECCSSENTLNLDSRCRVVHLLTILSGFPLQNNFQKFAASSGIAERNLR